MDRRDAIKRTAYLLGGTVSAPFVAAVLNGCQPTEKPDWLPEVLTPEQDKLVAEISEIIIPTTDTPGAKAALVNRFIDLLLKECMTEAEKKAFIDGLAEVEAKANEMYDNEFLDCEPAEQVAVLKEMEKAAREAMGQNPKPFFRVMKELTMLGYFTSEPGATKALEYLPVPGAYNACIPLRPDQKAWAM